MSIFTCCERLDESKYLHPCACPSATVECESEEVNAGLCGFNEATNNGNIQPSTPPKRYLKLTISGHGDYTATWTCGGSPYTQAYTIYTGSVDYYRDCGLRGKDGTNGPVRSIADIYSCVNGQVVPVVIGSENVIFDEDDDAGNINGQDSWWRDYDEVVDQLTSIDELGPSTNPDVEETRYITRSLDPVTEDTEQDAIDRETPTAGTSCSSLWETRSTGFSFTYRTSEYTIECVGLVVGVEYEVTPIIRKRTAVIGSYGAWEDVTVASETFTATATTKTLPAVLLGDDGNGEIIQGYEYEITGVHIEKKA